MLSLNPPAWVKENVIASSIILFLVVFVSINYLKPGVLYNEHGEIRPFGLGYSHKTVLPIWLFSVILAIFSYLVIRMWV